MTAKNGKKNGRGRPPRKNLTARDMAEIERMAGYGLTENQIAAVLGFSSTTMWRRKQEQAEITQALERGQAKVERDIGKALVTRAKSGDVAAIRWYEMTRAGRS